MNRVNGIIVPIVIVLIGILTITTISKMFSTERDYKQLVYELKNRTFGNRGIVAYELAKLIINSKIDVTDIPWLIENLAEIYFNSSDQKTRTFIVTALGGLKNPATVPTLEKIVVEALAKKDGNLLFNAIWATCNIPSEINFNWHIFFRMLGQEEIDDENKQAALFCLSEHQVEKGADHISPFLNNSNTNLKYAAATSLIVFRYLQALPVLQEVLAKQGSSPALYGVKMNVLKALIKTEWPELNESLKLLIQKEDNKSIALKAREVLAKYSKSGSLP